MCVSASKCPCYLGDTVVALNEKVKINGQVCTCKGGKLSCPQMEELTSCTSPMYLVNCSTPSTTPMQGAECQNSCQTLDFECLGTQCVTGCVCPDNMVSDGKGGCITEDQCPCTHNGDSYEPGHTLKVECNTCTCEKRKWSCTKYDCEKTCTKYGIGHIITFDELTYTFKGDCEYVFAEDYCGKSSEGSFRILIQDVACEVADSICSTNAKIILGGDQIKLSDGKATITTDNPRDDLPFHIQPMGTYIIIEINIGITVIWNKQTSLMIKLDYAYKEKICGLCGNYDDISSSDLTTRNHQEVTSPYVLETELENFTRLPGCKRAFRSL
ncbi:mucin-2-like [Thalassophryne amazonica]|uniref:mucin-2-like n=1 Tax=Thalassophryne amazonica TaxID=390379 RepID=UPI0014708857|nr:mucin-2-like [Thalassophryne amazonica]